jgi:hypothetical protein
VERGAQPVRQERCVLADVVDRAADRLLDGRARALGGVVEAA